MPDRPIARSNWKRCNARCPTTSSACMSPGWKASLAPASTKTHCAGPPAAATPTQIEPAMQVEPAYDEFIDRYGRGEAQVVWTTLVADLETPVSAFLKVANRPMSFLLESVEGGAVRGRYSIIGLEPDIVWRADGAAG